MAIPLLPIALALTAAGAGANYMGARKAERAHSDALAAERRRQKGFERQAEAKTAQSRDRYADIEPQMEDRASELADLFLADAGSAPPSLKPSSDAVTVQRGEDETAKRREYTDQQGTARANLLSFGDLFGDIGMGQARDMTDLSSIFSASRGSQGVLPFELDAAAQKGSGLRFAGDVLGGLGSIATMGALGPPGSLPGIFGGGTPAVAAGAMRPRARPAGLFSLGG